MRVLAGLVFIAMVAPAFGQAEVPLPKPRPPVETAAPSGAAAAEAEELAAPLPRPRPEAQGAVPGAETSPGAPSIDGPPLPPAAEPEPPQPPRVFQAACPAVLSGQVEATSLPPLAEDSWGERSPLAVTGVLVNGRMVPLSGEAIVNCGMATVLPEWAAAIDGYLAARENTRLARVLVGTSYMCRPRNNVSGADVSEHGFANALDVVGFELEDGRTISLPGGWTDPLSPDGRLLRFAHDAGCSRFTTTLGPEANALHHDHLHLDLGCHGSRCTARLCE
jgi:hypothetical protein